MGKFTYKIQRRFYGKWLKLKHKRNFNENGKLVADLNSKLILSKNSKINIEKVLILNENCIENNRRSTIIRLDENSEFNVLGISAFFYGSDIILFKNAKFTIGNSFINSDCKIRCHKSIKIGNNCAISHDFTVMDSDAHYLDGDNHTKPVVIKDNVWIGSRVMILSGVTVGEGAVIAAGSVVRCDVPDHSLVGGVPARIIKENIKWSE